MADLGVASDRLDQSEQRFSRLFEQATDLIFVTDLDGILTSVNRSFEKLIGYGRDELVGRRFEELVAPEYRDRARRARERKVAGVVDTTTYEFDLVASDGSVLELEVTSQLTRDNGEAVGVQCIARDVSERKRLEGRFRSLVQNASDVILVVSPDGTIRYVTPSAALVLGKGEAELVGGDLATMVHPSDRRRIMAFLAAAEHQDATGAAELRVHAGGDRWRYFEVLANDLTADAAVRGIVLTMRDVTDRKELEEQLTFQAFHDPLTGLANRALFTDRVSHSLAHRSAPARRVAVLFIDVDDFKTVNDSLGHDAGDQLLVQVADRLRAALRLGDTCARLGGDEFGVLLEQVPDVDYAVRVAERLGTAVAEPVAIEGREMALQTSIGVALQDPRGSSAHELLRNADIAMYLAKRDQLSRCRVFEPYMHTAALNRLELKGQLEQALARDEFTIQYQPIVSVATGRIAAIEALVRWHHPQRGLLAPSEFVELAEESGLIVPLGRWVLNEACHAARRWRERAPGTADLALSVNLSVRQLHGNGLPEQIDAILASHQCDPASLILEITESDLARDQASATEKLVRLRRLGVRIAVDDFGTGYSSLSLLHEYPVDILKIAKPFVDDLATGPAATLTSAIVSLGRTLGLETVAEGIETPEQRAELRRLGCDYGQGFLFSPPLTSDALERYLAQRVDVPQPAPIDGAVVDGTVVPPAA
ncbi:MAG: putative bifunctional diguanylate cyclase/phosphodiesterase [Gaiellales bacterium]